MTGETQDVVAVAGCANDQAYEATAVAWLDDIGCSSRWMILVAAADGNKERLLVLERQAEAFIHSERSRHQSSLR